MFLKWFATCGHCPSIIIFLIRENSACIPTWSVLMDYPRQRTTPWQRQKKNSDLHLETKVVSKYVLKNSSKTWDCQNFARYPSQLLNQNTPGLIMR